MPLPARLVVPMSQHLGAPNVATVAKGDRVERGQVIGTVDALISAPVHAPAAGQVADVLRVLTPSGVRSTAVVITVDSEQDREAFQPIPEGGTAAETARAAGLVGLGGAAFPASVKLAPPKGTAIDTLIVNGCECEPFLTCDHRVMVESAERVLAGARIAAKAAGASRIVVVVEDNKPDAAEALRAESGGDVEVVVVPTRYPQGAEKTLIASVTGRHVPTGKLPSEVGCLVHNVQTMAALADAVRQRKPLMERVVTVSGTVGRPGNYLVAIGTPITDLLAFAGGLLPDAARVVAGGPMTGQPLGELDVPVVKGLSGVIALTASEASSIVQGDQPCIRCGRCVEACPMQLHPFAIGTYAAQRRWDDCERYHALDCVECGCCAFACPTRRPLVQLIRSAKGALMTKGVRT